jgi:hypothetical protein
MSRHATPHPTKGGEGTGECNIVPTRSNVGPIMRVRATRDLGSGSTFLALDYYNRLLLSLILDIPYSKEKKNNREKGQ